ncbi:isotrichodermin C-15 hydroxylase [Pyricularia oryzae 70-15]|uniref:Isotrichodermin C-15 hydroxylase n=3 Tax=Pyricularia oryzae TaxID=318829 RepID=G4NHJ0_PYRO7|nr:isotrichodermin C-15 hydroxylase [Pyricularia oryzae 70-15]EHA47700.1 isotrichodermin C-15 hydroxylase [Pyricularia oryzae 70-15]ELQ32717.1 isotrichodermin C-15 hydroxylase [Pyricularia oryzae Y34]KAI7924767.1 isotrichodermin C-15 hydroxylase [Pyricularia oryzae]
MGSIAKEPLSSLDLLAAKGVLERLPTLGNWLLVGTIVYYVGLAIYRLHFHPLAKFPGPTLSAVSGIPWLWESYITGTFTWNVRKLHEKYGKIVRISPNRLAVDGSVGWSDIYSRSGGSEFSKYPGFFGPNGDLTIVGAMTKESHRRYRRALAHAFSETVMHEQEPLITYYVDLFIRRLSDASRDGASFNMVNWLNYVTFDIVGDLSFAHSFNSLENRKGHPWIENMTTGILGGAYNRFLVEFPLAFPAVFFHIRKAVNAFWTNRAYADEKSRARIAKGSADEVTDMVGSDGKPVVRKDFIGYMLRENKDKEALTEVEIVRNAETLMNAGSETTATCLAALTYLLSLPENRDWLNHVTNEVRNYFKREADVTLRSVNPKALPILNACIEESLRYHPPASETTPRVSPGALVNGHYIAKGCVVQIYQLATHHNPENFLECDSFRPQRFLPPTHPLYERRFANDNMASFRPFAYGSRDCIGKNLAYSEMRLVMARTLLRFDFVGVDPVSKDFLTSQRAFTVWVKPSLWVKFKERTDLELKA